MNNFMMPQYGGFGGMPQYGGFGGMPQYGGFGGMMPQYGGFGGMMPQYGGFGGMPFGGGFGGGFGGMPFGGGFGGMPQSGGSPTPSSGSTFAQILRQLVEQYGTSQDQQSGEGMGDYTPPEGATDGSIDTSETGAAPAEPMPGESLVPEAPAPAASAPAAPAPAAPAPEVLESPAPAAPAPAAPAPAAPAPAAPAPGAPAPAAPAPAAPAPAAPAPAAPAPAAPAPAAPAPAAPAPAAPFEPGAPPPGTPVLNAETPSGQDPNIRWAGGTPGFYGQNPNNRPVYGQNPNNKPQWVKDAESAGPRPVLDNGGMVFPAIPEFANNGAGYRPKPDRPAPYMPTVYVEGRDDDFFDNAHDTPWWERIPPGMTPVQNPDGSMQLHAGRKALMPGQKILYAPGQGGGPYSGMPMHPRPGTPVFDTLPQRARPAFNSQGGGPYSGMPMRPPPGTPYIVPNDMPPRDGSTTWQGGGPNSGMPMTAWSPVGRPSGTPPQRIDSAFNSWGQRPQQRFDRLRARRRMRSNPYGRMARPRSFYERLD